MKNPNANAITVGTRKDGKTLVRKKRVLMSGDTHWDLHWDDGSVDYNVHGQLRFYGVTAA